MSEPSDHADRGPPPDRGEFLGFDHLHFWVGNALQAAAYYICRFGFSPYAFRSLETGERNVMTQVVRQNDIIFAFSSPLEHDPNSPISHHTARHGDSIKDVAFAVRDLPAVFGRAVAAGATVIYPPAKFTDASGLSVTTATIAAADPETWHTFVERDSADGPFLPGFQSATDPDPQVDLVQPTELTQIDHCVFNQPDGRMNFVCDWFAKTLGFHRFWSVDEHQLHTEYSSLRSVVVTDYNERIKMPINEPAPGRGKSQIQEFVDYYDGAGVQHIALHTKDIVLTVKRLRQRGVSFLSVPSTYYEDLRNRLSRSAISVKEDLESIRRQGILVDFDEDGYLLQVFTKPLQDRPTLFFEVIQRCNHCGFGVGNFKSLFLAIEREQALRGNL